MKVVVLLRGIALGYEVAVGIIDPRGRRNVAARGIQPALDLRGIAKDGRRGVCRRTVIEDLRFVQLCSAGPDTGVLYARWRLRM